MRLLALAVLVIPLAGAIDAQQRPRVSGPGYSGTFASDRARAIVKTLEGRQFDDKDDVIGGGEWTVRGEGPPIPVFPGPGEKQRLALSPLVIKGPHMAFESRFCVWQLPLETDGDAAFVWRLVTGTDHDELRGERSAHLERALAIARGFGPITRGLRIGIHRESETVRRGEPSRVWCIVYNAAARPLDLRGDVRIELGPARASIDIGSRASEPGRFVLRPGERIVRSFDLARLRWRRVGSVARGDLFDAVDDGAARMQMVIDLAATASGKRGAVWSSSMSVVVHDPQRVPEPLDVDEATIAAIHAAFRSGDWTARRLVETYRARIAAHDRPRELNAYVVLNPRALERADALDREFQETGRLRPLHGIPIVVKDNYDTHDLQTAAGSKALEGSRPPDDAFVVQRIREAGGIVIGKSNMAEWAFSPYETVSSILGITRNPYDLERVPAGSSGGTAAAVAANLGTIGVGTDTGNSVRGPSSHCALVGIRPTIGLTSRDGIVPLFLGQDVGGPIARTVADAARLLAVMSGPDAADPVTAASRGRAPKSYESVLKIDGLEGARIGVLRAYFTTESTDERVAALMETAIEDLERLGAEPVDPFELPEFGRPQRTSRQRFSFRYDVNNYFATLGDGAPVRTLEEVVASGRFHPSVEPRLRRALRVPLPESDDEAPLPGVQGDPWREAMRDVLVAAMDAAQLDAIVYPTWSNVPRKVGDLSSPHGDNNQVLAPRTGMPALTVPMGYAGDRWPAGLQLLGRPFDEGRLIRLAFAYEQGTKHRRPPEGFGPAERQKR